MSVREVRLVKMGNDSKMVWVMAVRGKIGMGNGSKL